VAGLGCAGGAVRREAVPAPALDFRQIAVMDLSGGTARLATVLGRRPALLSFWAPWCEPCVREQPDLQRLAELTRPCGAMVLGVAVGEQRDTIAAFTSQGSITFPQVIDSDFHLADALGQRHIPTTLVLDGDQKIVFTGHALDRQGIAALKGIIVAGNAGCPGL
jgi:thiol-disulfide isomerase/thioredoxin